MRKKYNMIFLILAFIFSLFGIFLIYRKIKEQTEAGEVDLTDVFNRINLEFGNEIACNVEKIYRLESGHFSSNIYKKTGGAGMLAFSDYYPYGWASFSTFWNTYSNYKPVGVYESNNGYKYLIFKNGGGFFTLAEFLRQHGNNAGRWYSLDIIEQERYNNLLLNINTEFC